MNEQVGGWVGGWMTYVGAVVLVADQHANGSAEGKTVRRDTRENLDAVRFVAGGGEAGLTGSVEGRGRWVGGKKAV